ncbi:O-antigen ligase family protein [Candidatus Uhrbacteria bacterium]|nr:O-antigen ligase family protein [Candidatus Uhrbacteria bacterium]MBT7717416.1 O-antigen ligase family protein [Candidatus Uhrbacteria bacterium]
MNIKKQFVGDAMWIALSLMGIMHALAFFVRDTGFELPIFIIFGIFVLIVSWRSQLNGLLIAFAEIFVGGHGHLLDIEVLGFSLSIRMLIFAIVMTVWLIKYARIPLLFKEGPGVVISRMIFVRDLPWLVLIVAVAVGTLIGFLQNDPSAAFDDMNGYVVIGYLLPILTIKWGQENKRKLLQVLFASVVWIMGFTVALAYAFTHIDGDNLHNLYTFVRDSRLAEVTLQVIGSDVPFLNRFEGDYWYRIFMPTQTIVMFGMLLMYASAMYLWRKSKSPWFMWVMFGLSILTIILSLSRSFILGAVAGGLIIFITAWMFGKGKWSIVVRTLGSVVVSIFAVLSIIAIVQVPIPQRPDLSDAAFFETSSDTGRSEAVVSRWNLLDPMMDEIIESPIIGSGFGKEVTYTSEDPRIISELGNQGYTTYRFEWGWHDIWLKMGLLGLAGFIWYIVSIVRVGWFTMQSKGHKWLVIGLVAGIVGLFVTHTFSPYLNHPIGLSLMLFIIPFIDWDGFAKKRKEAYIEVRKKKLMKRPATVVASNIK